MSPTPLTAALLAAIAVSHRAASASWPRSPPSRSSPAVVVDARAVRRAPGGRARRAAHALARRAGAAHRRGARAAPARLRADPAGRAARPRARRRARPTASSTRRSSRAAAAATSCPRSATRSVGPLRLASWNHRPGEAGGGRPSTPTSRPRAGSRCRSAAGSSASRASRRAARSGSAPTSSSSATTCPTTTSARSTGARPRGSGGPMSNQYRVEQDRDVVLLVDAGRLAAAALPVSADEAERPRGTVLDATLDALAAVALVADEVGDRCGAIAFDREVRVALRPRRAGGSVVVRALHDLEPRLVDSDYEAAFRRVEGAKRAFVLILSDLLEPVAVRSLADAVPVLARRHAVVVASPADPALRAMAGDAAGSAPTTSRGSSRRPRCEDARERGRGAGARGGRGGGRRAAGDARARVRRGVPAGEVARAAVTAPGTSTAALRGGLGGGRASAEAPFTSDLATVDRHVIAVNVRRQPAPRQTTSPRTRRQPEPDRHLHGDRRARARQQPLREPAEHEPRRRPERELDAAPRLELQRPQPRPRARARSANARAAARRRRRPRCTRAPAGRARR